MELDWTIANFQDYLLTRIQAHAVHMEAYQLAATLRVQGNVKSAISDVWKSLSYGFTVGPSKY